MGLKSKTVIGAEFEVHGTVEYKGGIYYAKFAQQTETRRFTLVTA